ncbi:MAG: enoyl-CoA hydratase/isomerase family protein [Dehalococcoidia bacterium]|tara:strand:- start:772 stop:1557 length:786 start_codon:yes stop_codon:yes gene_type:complete
MNNDSPVIFEIEDKVGLITLNRPQAMNALNSAARDILMDALSRIHNDTDIQVGIITGAGGKAFSAGADLKEWSQPGSTGASGGLVEEFINHNPVDNFFTIPVRKPMIAAIDGYCLGGGLELALTCDIRIATERSSFGLPEVKRGFVPGGGGIQRILKAIPQAPAMEMVLTGNSYSAQDALNWGVISRIVTPENLLNVAKEIASDIAANAPMAIIGAKEIANHSRDLSLSEALRMGHAIRWIIGQTDEAKAGPKEFSKKKSK